VVTRTIQIHLDLPDTVSEQEKDAAEQKAREAVVLSLWEAQRLSTREAADECGLNYGEFLDLLAAEGIPVERRELNLKAITEASQKLARGRP
jgi:predicted HTH domain antitoxin